MAGPMKIVAVPQHCGVLVMKGTSFDVILPNGMSLNVEVTRDTISVSGCEKGQTDARVFYAAEIDSHKSNKQSEEWVQTWPKPESEEHVDDLLKSAE